MDAISAKLRKIARQHPDPIMRSEAERRLARRGSPMFGPESDQSARASLDATKRDVATLQKDVDDHSNFDMSEVPSRAANMVNRGVNAATFGLYNKVMDPLSEATGARLVPPREEREEYAAENPFFAGAADAIGSTAGAPAKVAGAVSGQIMQRLAPKATSILGRAAAGAISGGVSGATVGGIQGLSDTETLEGAGDGALIGGVIGGAIGGASEAAGGLVQRARTDRKVAALRKAERSGMYKDDPSLKAESEDDLNRVAGDGFRRIEDGLESREASDMARFGRAKEKVIAAEPQQDAQSILRPLQKLSDSNKGTQGQAIDPEVDRAIENVYRVMAPDESGKIATADLMAARRLIADRAEYGAPASSENRVWRILNKELSDMLPDGLKAANRDYATGKAARERINDVLQSSEESTVSNRAAKERAAIRTIRRSAEETEPASALRASGQIDEIADLDPSVANAFARQDAADAYLATRTKLVPDGASFRGFLRLPSQNKRAIYRGIDRVGSDRGSVPMNERPTLAPPIIDLVDALTRRRAKLRERKDQP